MTWLCLRLYPQIERFRKSSSLFGDHKLEASSSDKPQDLLVLHSRRKELQSNYTTPYVQIQIYIYVYIYSYPPPTKIKITNIGHTEHSHNIHMTAIICPVTGIGQVAALALQLERHLRPRLRRRVAVARCQAGRAAQRPRQLGNVGGDLGRWRLLMGVTSNGVAKGFHRNEYVFNMFRYVLILI